MWRDETIRRGLDIAEYDAHDACYTEFDDNSAHLYRFDISAHAIFRYSQRISVWIFSSAMWARASLCPSVTEVAVTHRLDFNMLNSEQLRFYGDNGFLVLEDVLDPDRAIAPLVREYEELAQSIVAAWVANGECEPAMLDGDFEEWIIAAYRRGLDYFQPLDI